MHQTKTNQEPLNRSCFCKQAKSQQEVSNIKDPLNGVQ